MAVTGIAVKEVGCTDTDVGEGSMEYDLSTHDEVHEDEENIPLEVNEENIFLQIETPTKNKRRKTENPLLDAYKEGLDSERNGLSEIASALTKVAEGINRFCDLYEKNNIK